MDKLSTGEFFQFHEEIMAEEKKQVSINLFSKHLLLQRSETSTAKLMLCAICRYLS